MFYLEVIKLLILKMVEMIASSVKVITGMFWIKFYLCVSPKHIISLNVWF